MDMHFTILFYIDICVPINMYELMMKYTPTCIIEYNISHTHIYTHTYIYNIYILS